MTQQVDGKNILQKFSPPTSPKGVGNIDKKHLNYVNQMKKSNGKVKEESTHMPSLTEVSLQVYKVLFNVYYQSDNFRFEKKMILFL